MFDAALIYNENGEIEAVIQTLINFISQPVLPSELAKNMRSVLDNK